jgi:hypothetical protein
MGRIDMHASVKKALALLAAPVFVEATIWTATLSIIGASILRTGWPPNFYPSLMVALRPGGETVSLSASSPTSVH